MVLRSLFLGTDDEVEWAFRVGPLTFKPKLITELNNILKNKYDESPIEKLGKMLSCKSLEKFVLQLSYGKNMKNALSSISIKNHNFKVILEKKINLNERFKNIPNTPFLESHYIKNRFFYKRRTFR